MDEIRANGHTSYLEVVSETEEATLASARVGRRGAARLPDRRHADRAGAGDPRGHRREVLPVRRPDRRPSVPAARLDRRDRRRHEARARSSASTASTCSPTATTATSTRSSRRRRRRHRPAGHLRRLGRLRRAHPRAREPAACGRSRSARPRSTACSSPGAPLGGQLEALALLGRRSGPPRSGARAPDPRGHGLRRSTPSSIIRPIRSYFSRLVALR